MRPEDDPEGACPPWCELPAGHPYADDGPERGVRYHVRTFGPADAPLVEVVRDEVVSDDGMPTSTRAWLRCDEIEDFDADQLRQLGLALVAAADLIEAGA